MAEDKNQDAAPRGGARPAGTTNPDILTEDDIAPEMMGDNALQGEDQGKIQNQRQAQAEAKHEADKDTLEAFRKMDKEER